MDNSDTIINALVTRIEALEQALHPLIDLGYSIGDHGRAYPSTAVVLPGKRIGSDDGADPITAAELDDLTRFASEADDVLLSPAAIDAQIAAGGR